MTSLAVPVTSFAVPAAASGGISGGTAAALLGNQRYHRPTRADGDRWGGWVGSGSGSDRAGSGRDRGGGQGRVGIGRVPGSGGGGLELGAESG